MVTVSWVDEKTNKLYLTGLKADSLAVCQLP